MSETLDVQADAREAYLKGRADFDFFSGLCMPQIFRFRFPPYYIALFLLLVKALDEGRKSDAKQLLKYAIGLPRGFAKTTFIKCLIAWLICYEKVTFVLIICATEPLSESFLADLHEILCSDNIRAVYGRWEPAVDQTNNKKGVFRRKLLIIKARGAGSAIRGIVEGNRRPDFVICDDMQTKENDDSEAEREDLMTWFVGTLLKTVDRFFAVAVYIGNMYSDHCILYQLKENPYWVSLITGAILEDGSSLWNDIANIDDLYESFLHDESLGRADIWFAEIMNDPIESIDSLLPKPLPNRILEVIPYPDASFVTVDPAGFRLTADDNVIAAHYLIHPKFYIAEMNGGIWNPGQTCENTILMALNHNASLVAIEAVAYQASLAYWMTRYLLEQKIEGISCMPLKRPQTVTKVKFIRNFIQELYTESYSFLRPQDRAKFVWQATAFRIAKKQNKDDWLDCPAMGLEVRNQFANLLSVRRAVFTFNGQARVISNNTPF